MEPKELRVIAYNTEKGLHPDYKSYNTIPEGMPKFVQVLDEIDELRRGLVGVSDAREWQNIPIAELRKQTGYKHIYVQPLRDKRLQAVEGLSGIENHDNAVAILSGYPIVQATGLRLGNRFAAQALIKLSDKHTLPFVVAYLDDLEEETRQMQAKKLLEALKEKPTAIVAGDLNSSSPEWSSPSRERLERLYKTEVGKPIQAKHGEQIEQMLNSRVIQLFREYGFDTALPVRFSPTFPTKKLSPEIAQPVLAIDHVMYRGSLTSVESYVHISEASQQASDHFPLVSTFSVHN